MGKHKRKSPSAALKRYWRDVRAVQKHTKTPATRARKLWSEVTRIKPRAEINREQLLRKAGGISRRDKKQRREREQLPTEAAARAKRKAEREAAERRARLDKLIWKGNQYVFNAFENIGAEIAPKIEAKLKDGWRSFRARAELSQTDEDTGDEVVLFRASLPFDASTVEEFWRGFHDAARKYMESLNPGEKSPDGSFNVTLFTV